MDSQLPHFVDEKQARRLRLKCYAPTVRISVEKQRADVAMLIPGTGQDMKANTRSETSPGSADSLARTKIAIREIAAAS